MSPGLKDEKMAKKNPHDKVAAAQIGPSEIVDKGDMPAAEREPSDAREFLGLSAEIAQDTIYVRNSRWDGAREDFPHEPRLRTCGKYFAGAVGGPLYIDEPVTKRDVSDCKRKAALMRARGLRYVYIHRINGMDPQPETVLAQLNAPAESEQRGVA
jgi:hypothetical protein